MTLGAEGGDIITFVSQNEGSFGQTVTHKIRRKTTDEQGNPGFITYGTSNNTDDKAVVTYPYVVGKYQRRIPKIGGFFQFLKTVPGYIVCILIPFSSLIVLQCINSVKLFNQYKSVQMRLIRRNAKKLKPSVPSLRRFWTNCSESKPSLLWTKRANLSVANSR